MDWVLDCFAPQKLFKRISLTIGEFHGLIITDSVVARLHIYLPSISGSIELE